MNTSSSRTWLSRTAAAWFAVGIAGQLAFAFSVAVFYGLSAGRGHWQSWNRFMTHGYMPDQSVGNGAVALHLSAATLLVVSGALQLVPQLRNRAPTLHRVNGRLYLTCAVLASLAGLFMLWNRGAVGDVWQHAASTLNAVLVLAFAGMTLRSALARDIARHRRWALRLYVVVLGVWFFRIALALWLGVFGGPLGFDPATFAGPALTTIAFAAFLLPLAIVEMYWRATDQPSDGRRFAAAAVLALATIATGLGATGAGLGTWLPAVRAAFDRREPAGDLLAGVVREEGIDVAVRRYRELKLSYPNGYNFDEGQLNRLGYALLRTGKLQAAIRILELNVEAYPRSSNAHDSLGEALAAAGDVTQAVASYRRAVELDPGNRSASSMLTKFHAQFP